MSRSTLEAVSAAAGALLPALSATEAAARRSTMVPAEQPVTTTPSEEPELAEGVKTQPVAVPVLLKSAEVRPEILSEKSRP